MPCSRKIARSLSSSVPSRSSSLATVLRPAAGPACSLAPFRCVRALYGAAPDPPEHPKRPGSGVPPRPPSCLPATTHLTAPMTEEGASTTDPAAPMTKEGAQLDGPGLTDDYGNGMAKCPAVNPVLAQLVRTSMRAAGRFTNLPSASSESRARLRAKAVGRHRAR
jgi:hypothetical protein